MPKSTTNLSHDTIFWEFFSFYLITEKKVLHLQLHYCLLTNKSTGMELNGILALFNLGTGEIIAIVLVILLLFGGRKIPELMRGLGKGVKSFKQGMNEVEEELKKPLEELDDNKPGSNPDNSIR